MFDYGVDECIRLTIKNKEAAPLYAYEFTDSLPKSFVKSYMQKMRPGCSFEGRLL